MDVKGRVIVRQRLEKAQLAGDLRQHFGALLQQRGDGGGVQRGVLHRLADVRLRRGRESLRGHGADIFAVEVLQLFQVEDGRGLRDAP